MEPFIGQITIFAGNFAPRGWAYCAGQLLPISQNQALFSILGTTYGGDGRTTFALPDLRGRTPRGSEGNSSGPGLPAVQLGEKGGAINRTLTVQQMPSHNHALLNNAAEETANQTEPGGHVLAEGQFYTTASPDARTLPANTGNQGGSQAFDILNPYLGLNYIIALQGIFPSRN